jgi:hypothetical protein
MTESEIFSTPKIGITHTVKIQSFVLKIVAKFFRRVTCTPAFFSFRKNGMSPVIWR